MNTKYHINTKANTGFSLIEVLITMLILAVGLMSIAALQFKGLQYSNDAHMRSNFNIFVYDIMDRMRNNRTGIAGYEGNYTVPTVWPGTDTCTESLSPATVANDLICWHQQLFNHLPPGTTANITSAAGAGAGVAYTQYIVTLSWENRDGTTSTIRHMLADPI